MNKYTTKDGAFLSADDLATWLESLHEADADGAITGGKWEPAQVAARAIRRIGVSEATRGGVTEEVVKLAFDAYSRVAYEGDDYGHGNDDGFTPMRAALEAVWPVQVQQGEPVVWRWRRRPNDKWEYGAWDGVARATCRVMREDGWEAEPLYAHAPYSQPSKELEP